MYFTTISMSQKGGDNTFKLHLLIIIFTSVSIILCIILMNEISQNRNQN